MPTVASTVELAGHALYEVAPSRFLRSSRGPLLWLTGMVGVGGPLGLVLAELAYPGTPFLVQDLLLLGLFVAVSLGIYSLSLSFNRFGVYECGVAPSKRTAARGWRLRGEQWFIPFTQISGITQHGSWNAHAAPPDQTWYFLLELKDYTRVILPAPGVWEAIRPLVRSPSALHRGEFRVAYEALAWAARAPGIGEGGTAEGRRPGLALDAAAFNDHLRAIGVLPARRV